MSWIKKEALSSGGLRMMGYVSAQHCKRSAGFSFDFACESTSMFDCEITENVLTKEDPNRFSCLVTWANGEHGFLFAGLNQEGLTWLSGEMTSILESLRDRHFDGAPVQSEFKKTVSQLKDYVSTKTGLIAMSAVCLMALIGLLGLWKSTGLELSQAQQMSNSEEMTLETVAENSAPSGGQSPSEFAPQSAVDSQHNSFGATRPDSTPMFGLDSSVFPDLPVDENNPNVKELVAMGVALPQAIELVRYVENQSKLFVNQSMQSKLGGLPGMESALLGDEAQTKKSNQAPLSDLIDPARIQSLLDEGLGLKVEPVALGDESVAQSDGKNGTLASASSADSPNLAQQVAQLVSSLTPEQHAKRVIRFGPADESGAKTVYVFADPQCPACKAYDAEMFKDAQSGNVSVQVIPVAIIDGSESIVASLLCASEPAKAWRGFLSQGTAQIEADPACIEGEGLKMARANRRHFNLQGLQSTPSTIFGYETQAHVGVIDSSEFVELSKKL